MSVRSSIRYGVIVVVGGEAGEDKGSEMRVRSDQMRSGDGCYHTVERRASDWELLSTVQSKFGHNLEMKTRSGLPIDRCYPSVPELFARGRGPNVHKRYLIRMLERERICFNQFSPIISRR